MRKDDICNNKFHQQSKPPAKTKHITAVNENRCFNCENKYIYIYNLKEKLTLFCNSGTICVSTHPLCPISSTLSVIYIRGFQSSSLLLFAHNPLLSFIYFCDFSKYNMLEGHLAHTKNYQSMQRMAFCTI